MHVLRIGLENQGFDAGLAEANQRGEASRRWAHQLPREHRSPITIIRIHLNGRLSILSPFPRGPSIALACACQKQVPFRHAHEVQLRALNVWCACKEKYGNESSCSTMIPLPGQAYDGHRGESGLEKGACLVRYSNRCSTRLFIVHMQVSASHLSSSNVAAANIEKLRTYASCTSVSLMHHLPPLLDGRQLPIHRC